MARLKNVVFTDSAADRLKVQDCEDCLRFRRVGADRVSVSPSAIRELIRRCEAWLADQDEDGTTWRDADEDGDDA